MSHNIKCVFEIPKNEFIPHLMKELVKSISQNHNLLTMSEKDLEEAGNNLVGIGGEDGVPWIYGDYLIRGQFKPKQLSYNLHIFCMSNKWEECPDIPEDRIHVFLITSYREVVEWKEPDIRLQEMYIKDLIAAYEVLKPYYGRAGLDLEFPGNNCQNYLLSINIFTPSDVKKIGREKIVKVNAHKIVKLDNGGILVVLGPNLVERNDNINLHEVAKLWGLKYGVSSDES